MHTSTANISKMVTDRAIITITIKYKVAYGFLIGIYILPQSTINVNLAVATV